MDMVIRSCRCRKDIGPFGADIRLMMTRDGNRTWGQLQLENGRSQYPYQECWQTNRIVRYAIAGVWIEHEMGATRDEASR